MAINEIIHVTNLVKKYETGVGLTVLKKLSFTVPEKQFLGITGKSGAGKSTLLYQLSLLDRPTSGKILIEGKDIDTLSDQDRVLYRRDHFGFIFQDYALLPTLTAIENVMLPLLMQGVSTDEASKNAQKTLERVELVDKLNNLPSQLSGGQQQRVSIARSVVHNPRILFADEPTANLDSESSKNVLDTFAALNKTGLTIIMVTHERDYAKRAHRVIELKDGVIVADRKVRRR